MFDADLGEIPEYVRYVSSHLDDGEMTFMSAVVKKLLDPGSASFYPGDTISK